MPRFKRRHVTNDNELRLLEEELRSALQPVEAADDFVQRVGEHLRNPRPLSVYQARSWEQTWVLIGSIGGTLLTLAVIGLWLWLRSKD